MSKPATDTVARLRHLEQRFASRRALLASEAARPPKAIGVARPLGTMQQYGYPIALALALPAILPFVLKLTFKRRRILFKVFAAVLRIRKLGTRIGYGRMTGGRR